MGGVPIALAGVTGFIASRSRRLALAYDATYLKGTPVGEGMFFGGVLHAEMKTDTGVPSCLPSVRPHSRGRFSRTILADDSRGGRVVVVHPDGDNVSRLRRIRGVDVKSLDGRIGSSF